MLNFPTPFRWARATLEEHAGDPRPGLLPYSQLDRGASGDAFWDAAQKQLVRTGKQFGACPVGGVGCGTQSRLNAICYLCTVGLWVDACYVRIMHTPTELCNALVHPFTRSLPAGELHNNVRMTWGKAFLQWGPTPEAALR